MMHALTGLALAAGGSLELSILVKVTLVAALGLTGVAVARRTRASRRYVILAATFAAILALPLAVALAPPVGIAVPATPPAPVALSAGESMADASDTSGVAVLHPLVVPGDDLRSSGIRALGTASLIRLAWLTGVALFLLPVVVMVWHVRALRRMGLPWLAGDAVAASLARAAGISRRVTVLLHEDVEAPMTCGLWRPAILLPRDAPIWNDADVQRALLHELEHVRRCDWPAHILARATCALYWFHPLVWMAWRRFDLEAERACDDAVAARTDRNAYAEQLVLLAQRLSPGASRPALAMAGRGDLSHRVLAVLDDRQARGRAGRISTAAAAIVAAVILAGISPLKAVDAPQASASAPSDAKPAFEVASIRRSPPGDDRTIWDNPSAAMFAVTNADVRTLIGRAYAIPLWLERFLLIGGPEEVLRARYDIRANPPERATADQRMIMLRALLEQRFKLRTHTETRQVPVFALIVPRDGTLGPNFRTSDHDCAAWATERSLASREGRPIPIEPRDEGGRGWCLGTYDFRQQQGGPGLRGAGQLSDLVSKLQAFLDRPIVDETGLKGNFEWQLAFSLAPIPAGDSSLPPIHTAIEEQLGLKLDRRIGSIEVRVIDSVDLPTPN